MSRASEVSQVPSRTSHRFNLVSATLAFLLWGSWAYFVNRDGGEGRNSPLISGLTQGTGSFLITLIMVRTVTWLYHNLPRSMQLLLPALITVSITGSCLAAAHIVVGTPNIIRTIAPALSVAFLFNVYTAVKLRRAEAAHHFESEARR